MTSQHHLELLERGITAARKGDLDTALPLLHKVAEEAPEEKRAQSWLDYLERIKREAAQHRSTAVATSSPPTTPSPATNIKADTMEEGWQCPFCDAGSSVKRIRCDECGALLTVSRLSAFNFSTKLDRACLEESVRRLSALADGDDKFRRLKHLALAMLNLGRPEEGLTYLEEASSIRPSDRLLRNQASNLRSELIDSGVELARPSSAKQEADANELWDAEAAPPQEPSQPPEAPNNSPTETNSTFSPWNRPDSKPEELPKQDTVPMSPVVPQRRQKRRRFILLVDDSPTIQKLVTLSLEREGYAVLVASDGLEALSKVYEFTPDLILLDITMPNLDGFQLCGVIKANERTSRTPIVMFTSKGSEVDRERGQRLGAVDHIVKPVNPETLNQILRKHLDLGQGERT